MNGFQQLIDELNQWKEHVDAFIVDVQQMKKELYEIERVLNDFRHVRENFLVDAQSVHQLAQFDLREHELLRRRRTIKAELQHYEKCRGQLEAIHKQAKALLAPSNHHYQTAYQVKSLEGNEWFERFAAQGFTSTVNIQYSEHKVRDEEEAASPINMSQSQPVITVHIHQTKKYWHAVDANTQQQIARAKKFKALLEALPANVVVTKSPKAVEGFIQQFQRHGKL